MYPYQEVLGNGAHDLGIALTHIIYYIDINNDIFTLHACTRGKVISLCGFVCCRCHCCRCRHPKKMPVWEIIE